MNNSFSHLYRLILTSLCFFVLACLPLAAEEYIDYTGHTLIRAFPHKLPHFKLIQSFQRRDASQIDFWKDLSTSEGTMEMRVAPSLYSHVTDSFKTSGVPYQILNPNIQKLIDEEKRTAPRANSTPGAFNLTVYHNYSEIIKWLDAVAAECGNRCSTFIAGRSSEGRVLKGITIGNAGSTKPAIWIDAGTHAREWISPATAVYIINTLVKEYDSDAAVKSMVDHYVWHILPLVNPDGYQYTWTTDRLWRKTRSVHPKSGCRGADANRNWNFHWSGPGTSRNPCDENFSGRHPFSEPEIQALSQYILSIKHQLKLYLSLHSYGQLWLTPWGFSYRVPQDYNDMIELATSAVSALLNHTGANYRIGSSSRILYLAAGGSDDWVKAKAGVKYAYTVELADTGQHGFILPARFINSTGHGMFNALKAATLHLTSKEKKSA